VEAAVTVRLAGSADIDTLIRARADFFATQGWELDSRQLVEQRAQWSSYISEQLGESLVAALVTDTADEVISVAFLAISERPATLTCPTGKLGTILNVFTYPEHRRHGHSRVALELLIAEARIRGLSRLELSASRLGEGVYRQLGFAEVSSEYLPMRLSLLE